MKKNTLLYVATLLLMVGFTQKSLAQDWTTYAKAIDNVADGSTYVYFYNVDQGKFITTGGAYGVEGIFANVGMRFQIAKNGTDNYSVISTVNNATAGLGSYMAFANNSLFLDRAEHETNWQFNTTTATNEYTMSENSSTKHQDFVGYYIGLSTDNKRLIPVSASSSATKWLLITEADYRTVISNQEAQFIDVSGLIRDPGFVRNSKDVTSWIWTDDASTGHSLGMTSDVYCGTQEMYLSADNADATAVDKGTYEFPVRLNLRRAFTQNAWNAIVLPMNLSGDQVKAAFGNGDAKLSKLVGINPNKSSQILFEKVNLDKDSLYAGTCYVVYVTKGPDVAKGVEYKYTYLNTDTKTIYGPLYQIEGVTQKAYTDLITPTTPTNDGKLSYTGYYYKIIADDKTNVGAPINSYMMGDGKMYYLDKLSTIYGTTWVLKDVDPSAKELTVSINGVEDNTVTGISGLIYSNAKATSNKIFNLNGQMVKSGSLSTEDLPKGIYIINGKKCVVK
jgi:hypothetical protein